MEPVQEAEEATVDLQVEEVQVVAQAEELGREQAAVLVEQVQVHREAVQAQVQELHQVQVQAHRVQEVQQVQAELEEVQEEQGLAEQVLVKLRAS